MMMNNFKLKKYWFLTLFMLITSTYWCSAQSLLTVQGGLEKPNGQPIYIVLNSTSLPAGCTSQTITLNIGRLTYLSESNRVDTGILVTPKTTNGETILTISNIINGNEGNSKTITIGAQFAPDTCDYTTQQITASFAYVGCSSPKIDAAPITLTAKTQNKAMVSFYKNDPESKIAEPYCLKKIIKYNLNATNSGTSGFNITNAQLFLELDKCAEIIGIYKRNTYESVNPDIASGSGIQTAVFDIPNLGLSSNNQYDVYVRYPCLDGLNDCTSGLKNINAYFKGRSCGSDITSNKVTVETNITTTNVSCGDTSCTSGTGIYVPPTVILRGSLKCPTACDPASYIYYDLSIPPFNPNYTNSKVIVDIPPGIAVTAVSRPYIPSCKTYFTVNYINSADKKSETIDLGSLTRQVEFTTSCPSLPSDLSFYIYFKYDTQMLPLPSADLPFKFKFTSDEITINDNSTVKTANCYSQIVAAQAVKKELGSTYAANVSGLPGETFTYRLQIYNNGTGANVNTTITDVLNSNLEYAGGFKYAFDNLEYQNLLGNSSFTIPDLGTVIVKVPKVGESGTVNLTGFDFPCTSKRLYIEFNVKVKDYVMSGTELANYINVSYQGLATINIIPLSYVKSKMFVKCSLSDEWKENSINVKNGEEVDFKMQIINAGSNPVTLSELINLKPQPNDQFEFGSDPRKSNLKINYSCDLPKVTSNLTTLPVISFKYAQNPVSMDRDMLCPPQTSGNAPNWTVPCDLNTNWLKATFPSNFTLKPGDFVEVTYKGKISGNTGIANNSFAFKIDNCSLFSDNSNVLTITNDGIGIGCKSCTLTNPNAIEIKKLFENLLKNIMTRLVNGETDTQINGSKPNELFLLKPYISNGGGDKIYQFVSARNAQNKITSIRFSFSANSENDVSFLEENGLHYDPEVGAVDASYLKIDTSLFVSPDQYLTTCRKATSETTGTDCKNRTEVRYVDFCPDKFCVPISGEIKTIVP